MKITEDMGTGLHLWNGRVTALEEFCRRAIVCIKEVLFVWETDLANIWLTQRFRTEGWTKGKDDSLDGKMRSTPN